MAKSSTPSTDETVEILPPDHSLQEKTGASGRGSLGQLFTADRIRSAQQVIEDHKATYFEDLSAYLAELHAASTGEIDYEPLMASVKSLKAQSESLGFDFILQVCQALYQLLGETRKEEYTELETLVIGKHAEAILAGVRKKERGKGGMVEEETLASLHLLRKKMAEMS